MFKDFQVKMISKDVSGTCKFIKKEILDLCFAVNFLNFKNTFLYRTLPVAASENTHWINEITNKYTWFSRKILVFHRKWKIRKVAVLDLRSATCLEAFLIKQGVPFFARLQCFWRVQRRAHAIARLICRSLIYIYIYLYIYIFIYIHIYTCISCFSWWSPLV